MGKQLISLLLLILGLCEGILAQSQCSTAIERSTCTAGTDSANRRCQPGLIESVLNKKCGFLYRTLYDSTYGQCCQSDRFAYGCGGHCNCYSWETLTSGWLTNQRCECCRIHASRCQLVKYTCPGGCIYYKYEQVVTNCKCRN